MNLIRRIGTERHKFKLEFVMRKIKFTKYLQGKIYVSIRRGDHKMKTESEVEMSPNGDCDLKKQIVSFPSITLFYDQSEHKYQEKTGDMKILLINNNGDKKLLGIVPFDVAEFVNSKRQTGLVSNQTEEKVKKKQDVQEIPQKLNMKASIQYNVFIKFIGEASQTDKSIKDDKIRSQSPFDKLKTFFFGNENQQEQKPKQQVSPRKGKQPVVKERGRQSKQYNGKGKQGRQRKRSPVQFEFQEEEKPKQTPKRQRSGDYNIPKNTDKEKKRKRANKGVREGKLQDDEEEQKPSEIKGSRVNIKKHSSKIQRSLSPLGSEQQNSSQQQREKNRKKEENKQAKSKKNSINKNIDERNLQKPSKNIVQQKQRDILTQYEDKSNKKSNFNKSQQPYDPNKNNQFFFDDPNSFPPHLQPPKKDKTSTKKNNDLINAHQSTKKIQDDIKPEKQYKTDNRIQIQEHRSEDKESQNEDDNQAVKNVQTGPSPKRKVKENSIQISTKQLQKEVQKKKRKEEKAMKKEIIQQPPLPKKKQTKQTNSKEIRQKEEIPKQVQLNSSEIKNLFNSFDEQQPPIKVERTFNIDQKNRGEVESSIFLKEELDRKAKDLLQMKIKLDNLQAIQKKLKQQQALRQAAQKTASNLKDQNKRLEKDLQRVQQQNNNLKTENENQSGIFRSTQNHYLNNTQQNDLQEENKRLERQKNEMIVNMTKQKQKHTKEVKLLKQELEKEKMKYKQLQNLSKIDLKKLKDENLKLSGNAEIMKDKNKEKIRQNQTLLKQNKTLNTQVIELKEKLAALKLKICDKLNEANQHGQSQLMEVLTELCEDM